MSYPSTNPSNGNAEKSFPELSDPQLQSAIASHGKRLASRIDPGMIIIINHRPWTTPDLPFGGIKDSGYGRELSPMGVQEFVNKKLVCVASICAVA